MAAGIRKRGDSYEAAVYLKREDKKVRRTFPTLAAAKSWRAEAVTAANKGVLRTPTRTTLREAWTAWLEGTKAGDGAQPQRQPLQAERPAVLPGGDGKPGAR
jgi:hypothetical protein